MSLPTTFAGKSKASFLPFYDPFTRANGPLVAPWQSGGATWTIAGNEAVNTPTEGADLIVNGGFAADSDWDKGTGWTIAGDVGVGAGGTPSLIKQDVLITGAWYLCVWTLVSQTAGNFKAAFDTNDGVIKSVPDTYSHTGRAAGVQGGIKKSTTGAGTIDDVSFKALTLNTLFSNVETGTADVVCQVELDTIAAGTQAGLVLNLDDKDTPANFVIAYHDGINCKLEKCVAGTYTTVITAVTAYAAGATIQVVKSGTDYSLYYNSAQVGATQTINDAGIIDNTQHGMFSTYSGNQLDEFRCEKN